MISVMTNSQSDKPVPKRLMCPRCNSLHLDPPAIAKHAHIVHICDVCGHAWQPFDYPTVGVTRMALETVLTQAPEAEA